MSRDSIEIATLLEALQRLGSALEDMTEELPGQMALAENPDMGSARKIRILEVVEKQLRWLVEDMARTRAALVAQEQSHDRYY